MAKRSKHQSSTTPSELAAFDKPVLTKLLASTGNSYAAIVEDIEETFNFFDTGSYSLNLVMSGNTRRGHPDNYITVLAGEATTGKSFFVIGMIKEFLKKNPAGFVFVFESENAPTWSKASLTKLGISPSNVSILPVTTIQETTVQATKLANMYLTLSEEEKYPVMMVVDSLGQLSTTKEMKDTTEGNEVKDMTRPGEVKKFFRVMCQKLGRAKIPMFVTNHVYDVIGAYVPTKAQGGGKGPIYTASTILTLSKAKDKDKKTKEVRGVIVTVKVTKGRLTKENMSAKTRIDYRTGLDRYYGLFEVCELYGLIEKKGNRYELPNGLIGFRKDYDEHPEQFWTEEVLDIIDKEIGEKYFMYGGDGEPIIVAEDEENV
jgi:RecA/RadA recombinase